MHDSELLKKYEPVLRFAKSERFFPMAVELYLEKCTIHPSGPQGVVGLLAHVNEPLISRIGKLYSGEYYLRVRAPWRPRAAAPRVEVAWRSGGYRVKELFFCPDTDKPRLIRRVTVSGAGPGRSALRLMTGVLGREVEAGLTLRAGAPSSAAFEYRLARRAGRASVEVRTVGDPGETSAASSYWAGTASCRFSDPRLERFFAAAKFQLRAAGAASGRLDGSVWQYNLEWVRDQSFIALALAMSGQASLARTMLRPLLAEFVDADGATMDSSRFRPWPESEFGFKTSRK